MLMQINGLSAELNLPNAPKGDGTYSLPPYDKQNVYKVDDYAGCPQNWMHGSAKAASYFLPVDTDKHLWLDFNTNWAHAHQVAIIMSIQGVNPITGLPTKSLRLEQYRDKCITHGEEFGADRFCYKCNDNIPGDYGGVEISNFPSKWPPQNYMTTVNHVRGQLWIDGWLADDNTIRGFLITSEMMRGVAAQIIGEDRVWAIGIAFYLSKEPKPQPKPQARALRGMSSGISGQSMGSSLDHATYSCSINSMDMGSASNKVDWRAMSVPATNKESLDCEEPIVADALVDTEKLEIGAGAKIKQKLCYIDPNDPSFYKDEPEGLIYINYTDQELFTKIIAAGKRHQKTEGYLTDLVVGND